MELIEVRYPQGETGLKVLVQLASTSKYWNEEQGTWDSEADNCYLDLVERSSVNINGGLFPWLANCTPKDGIYRGILNSLTIAEGVSYSIHLYKQDGELTLISTTLRQKAAGYTLLELVREIQLRTGYPQSKSLAEPQARKIQGFINDIINEVIAEGNAIYDLRLKYTALIPEGTSLIRIAPANTFGGISSLGDVIINSRRIQPYNDIWHKTDGNSFTYNCVRQTSSQPISYIYESKNNYEVILSLDSVLSADTYAEIDVYEKPRKLSHWSDRTILDNDLIIKGTEYLLRDDAGMGGEVSGRELFLRLLRSKMNINSMPDWRNFRA